MTTDALKRSTTLEWLDFVEKKNVLHDYPGVLCDLNELLSS